MRHTAALLFFLSTTALAQSFQFGLKAGVPLTQYFDTGTVGGLHGYTDTSAATRRYTFGASVEWRVTGSFGFEADALYHRMGYVDIVRTYGWTTHDITYSIDVKGNSWDFPVMAKYRFARRFAPYVAGGVVGRYAGPVRGRGEQVDRELFTGMTTTTPVNTTDPTELRKRFYVGVTGAAGLELGAQRRFRLLPEIRYTRWTGNNLSSSGILRFTPDQVEFLVGVLF